MGIRMSLMKRSKIEAYRSIFNYNPNYGISPAFNDGCHLQHNSYTFQYLESYMTSQIYNWRALLPSINQSRRNGTQAQVQLHTYQFCHLDCLKGGVSSTAFKVS